MILSSNNRPIAFLQSAGYFETRTKERTAFELDFP